MSTLPILPKPPEGVQLGLKCPQSVLFLDLTFRGNLAPVFRRVYGIDYSPAYIAYDATEKSWDFTNNEFNRHISPELDAEKVAQKFITTTHRTAKQLIRIAQIVSSPTRWRKSHIRQDLLEDLNLYWDTYEEHTICSYVFWAVEHLLMNSLIDELNKAGFKEEVESGLPTFIFPSDPNWFTLESCDLEVLKSRFANASENEITAVAEFHANMFGFMSTPYQLGTRPSGADMAVRIKQPVAPPVENEIKSLKGFPEKIVRLGELVRELAYLKSERIDTYALADFYATPMYKSLSDLLEVPLNLIFCMTRDEITSAVNGKGNVPIEILKQRDEKYCRALIDGTIEFYQPTEAGIFGHKEYDVAKKGDVISGMATSPGVVQGRVRILSMDERDPEFSTDEIIVTSMTRPELGGALDIALAYATDEGGRLCHAAIVSREKKKPCVTALGKVTKVLRTGMIIEVDGSAGTVTVIDDSFQ